VRKADNLTTILGHCHVIWELQLPGTLWAPRACNGTDLPFYMILVQSQYFMLSSFVCTRILINNKKLL